MHVVEEPSKSKERENCYIFAFLVLAQSWVMTE